LRQVYGRLDENLFWIAARGYRSWTGTEPINSADGVAPPWRRRQRRSQTLSPLGLHHFPRLAPAIIVLVERGRALLLARSHHFAKGMYSVIAGFVEPGETLEEAVVREVREEIGISIKDIRYFGSQPWPFPHSLMIGFNATYEGGEIVLDDSEIEEAGWFTRDNLPPLPGKISIARKLIDGSLKNRGMISFIEVFYGLRRVVR